jgi:hypothetical protein
MFELVVLLQDAVASYWKHARAWRDAGMIEYAAVGGKGRRA